MQHRSKITKLYQGRVAEIVRAVGERQAALLLRVPITTIQHWLARDRYALATSNQRRLIDLVLKDVKETPVRDLRDALRLIIADLDRRGAARVLGISVATLDSWLNNPRNIPRNRYRDIFRIAGNNLEVFRRRVVGKYKEMVERGYDGVGKKVKSKADFDRWIEKFIENKILWETTRDDNAWNWMMASWRESGLYKAGVRMFGY